MFILRSLITSVIIAWCCTQTAFAKIISVRQNGFKIMVVGDSISHGGEGDHTWRYRLWQWLETNNIHADFVGPWKGTRDPVAPGPPQPPLLQGEVKPPGPDLDKGSYALDIDPGFPQYHYAQSGRAVAVAKNLIAAQIATYQPDYVLVELGFNDLGWFYNGPSGLLSDMKILIDNARSAKDNIKFAIANVPQRTLIVGRQDLIDNTKSYNALLASAIPSWSISDSPVKLVDFEGNYNCGLENCPAGFDGLHPNMLGEYEIAQAFSRVLNRDYGIGSGALDVPANLPVPSCPMPTNVQAKTAPFGVVVTWDHVFGARGYNVRSKRSSFGDWSDVLYTLTTNQHNQIWVLEGETWQFQVRTNCGDKTQSDFSGIVSADVHQTVASGPKNVVVNPTRDGFIARWDPPDGNYNILLYEVFSYDTDMSCAWLMSRGIKGNSITVNGLTPGHKHIVAISTWTDLGPGFPTVPLMVMPGAGVPSAPHDLKLDTKDGTTVILNFVGDSSSANYRTWARNINNASDFLKAGDITTHTPCNSIYYLFPGAWNYEFCVSATNGNLESPKSDCIVASKDITPGVAACPVPGQTECHFGEPGNGGDGSGQPGEPGSGEPGTGNGNGNGTAGPTPTNGGSGYVYIDPIIWKDPKPQVTCAPPCDFILPPTVLPTPITITLPPYTTDLEIVWTSNGQTTRSFQTTTITLPPIITQTVSFWAQTYPGGPEFSFSPVPSINPPPIVVTNDKNPEVKRTITPYPYPTEIPVPEEEDPQNGGPYPSVYIHNGPSGPICGGPCGDPPCKRDCGPRGLRFPCIPLFTCPRDITFQDPSDPDTTNTDPNDPNHPGDPNNPNNPDPDDPDDPDDPENPKPPCPFLPLDAVPAVNPYEPGPNDQFDIQYSLYPGPSDEDQGSAPPGSSPTPKPTIQPSNPPPNPSLSSPAPSPTIQPSNPPPVATHVLWVLYANYIDQINDEYWWQFFTRPIPTDNWSPCEVQNELECDDWKCYTAPDGELTKPPWPSGSWTMNRGASVGCTYHGDGTGPGTLQCPNMPVANCFPANKPFEVDCNDGDFTENYYPVAVCQW